MFLRCSDPFPGALAPSVNKFTLENHVYAALILLALPPSFELIKTHFLDGLSDPTSLSVDTITARIIEKDQRNRAEVTVVNTVTGPSTGGNKKGGKAKAAPAKREGEPPRPCFHCGKVGHWNADCRQKKKLKKKPDQSGASSSLHVVETGSNSDAESHVILCYFPSCEDWLMDSGATEHLTPHLNDYKSYQAYPESKATYVTLGDSKTQLRVHGSGTVERWVEDPNTNKPLCQLVLSNVLHVPGIKRRFLSLSTFDDKGFELHIKNRRMILAKGNVSLIGSQVGKLYIAPMWRERPSTSSTLNQLYSAITKPLSTKTWHKRMGHLNWEALKSVKASEEISPLKGIVLANEPLPHSSTCTGCQAGKAHRKSHQASQTRFTRSSHPLKQVHLDLVGPIQTASINGHRFAVSFTCEYTDHVWSIPMKSKDQTLAIFKQFSAQVKRQYGLSIRRFRSDRGGEFMSKDFDTFLASEGIIRETSAPDTPQQNGLAERMQQTIWSGIRAILHQSGMKFGFWAEALSVIVHVLNCAPRKRMDW